MIEKMPNIAMGTWEVRDHEVLKKTIPAALNNGYRHIDTAQIYFNEELIGDVLSKLDIPRDEYWITSKVWTNNFRYHTYESVKKSIERLKTKYIDTMLLHAMTSSEDNIIAYKELMRAREDKLVRTIGVSNFSIEQLKKIKDATGEYPKYNQIVNSVKQRIFELEVFCKENGITLMGYSSIRPYYNPNAFYGKSGLSNDEKKIIDEIASIHNSSPAMVMLKWSMNHGYVILPKSNNPERVISNFNVTKLNLTDDDMETLNKMNNFGDEEFASLMKEWSSLANITDEDFKYGVRLSPESDARFIRKR